MDKTNTSDDTWKSYCNKNSNTLEESKFQHFSRMVLNSYIIHKEDIPTGSKPTSRLDFNVNAMHKEWLHERSAAGKSAT
jgi:hypothetical protein